jgi:hypothetical protein
VGCYLLSPMIASDSGNASKETQSNPHIPEIPHDHGGALDYLRKRRPATLPLSSQSLETEVCVDDTLPGKRKPIISTNPNSPSPHPSPNDALFVLSLPCLGRLSPRVACTRGARSSSQLAGPRAVTRTCCVGLQAAN